MSNQDQKVSNDKSKEKFWKEFKTGVSVIFGAFLFLVLAQYGCDKLSDYINPRVPTGSFYSVSNPSVIYGCSKLKFDLLNPLIPERCDSRLSCVKGVEYLNGSYGGLVQLTDKDKNPIQCVYTAK